MTEKTREQRVKELTQKYVDSCHAMFCAQGLRPPRGKDRIRWAELRAELDLVRESHANATLAAHAGLIFAKALGDPVGSNPESKSMRKRGTHKYARPHAGN
jgi:hypothetical protein